MDFELKLSVIKVNKSKLCELTIAELSQKLFDGEIRATDVVGSCLDRIEKTQETTNAFVAYDPELALETAQKQDLHFAEGVVSGPLHGIPIAVKDNYLTADYPTTACSKIYPDNPVGLDSTMVAKLRSAGAIVIGKTNMHEWAYGATNEESSYGTTRNPWNSEHITGGSSGGSGAALAARMVPAALGSDTGGSIRIPSSACGVSGLKPTAGRVSRTGILPLSWTLDIGGPMARSAQDLRILFNVVSGFDPKCPTTYGICSDNQSTNKGHRFRIALFRSSEILCDDTVMESVEQALDVLRDDGAVVDEVSFSGLETGFGAWKILLHCEAAAYHAKFLAESADLYSDNVRVQVEAGRCLSASTYLKAQQYRAVFNQRFSQLTDRYDLIAMPTLPVTAPRIGQSELEVNNSTITSQDAMTSIAWIANFTGLPATSVPCGFDERRLPIGLMFVGPAFGEETILSVAERYQALTQWHKFAPSWN